jgi:tRNA (guanine37-N1)-methyltransferase
LILNFTVLTLFPELIEGFFAAGLARQAVERGLAKIQTVNPRKFTADVHQTVDDRAYGGGDGMVMKLEPLEAAVRELRSQGDCLVVVLSPQGRKWTQALAKEFAKKSENIVLVCGRYAGIDHRFMQLADDEISLGDFILNGGEIAACAVIESVVRLKPGVLGNHVSADNDSFSGSLLECPQFTRPREVLGMKVPSQLLGGNHAEIARFERTVSRVRTALLRPDMITPKEITADEIKKLLELEDSELKALGLDRDRLNQWGKV